MRWASMVVATVALGLTGCTSGIGQSATPATGTTTAGPVIVTESIRPNGAPAALHLVTTSGTPIGSLSLPDLPGFQRPNYPSYPLANTPPRLAGDRVYYVEGGLIKSVGPDAHVTVFGSLQTPGISSRWGYEVGLAVSPDGRQIAYGYPVGIDPKWGYASRISVESAGGAPRQLVDDTADEVGFLLPFAWTSRGIWASLEQDFDGSGPFGKPLGYRTYDEVLDAKLIDPATGAYGPADRTCEYPDRAAIRATGAGACIITSIVGRTLQTHIRVTAPDGTSHLLTTPPSSDDFGDFVPTLAGTRVVVATAGRDGQCGSNGWSYQGMRLADAGSGAWTAVGPSGYLPIAWVDSRTFLAGHIPQPTKGTCGGSDYRFDAVSVLDAGTGHQTIVNHDPRALGVLRAIA